MAEEQLNSAQVGGALEQMCGEAVPQRVRMQRLVDAGPFGGFAAGVPDNLVADGGSGGVAAATREKPNRRFAGGSAIMGAQFVGQTRAEHDGAILAPLAPRDMG